MSAISLIEEAAPAAEIFPAPLPLPAVAAPAEANAGADISDTTEKPSRGLTLLPIVAVTLAALASFMAVAGLAIANRTVVRASLIVADAQERQEQLAKVGELIEQVEAMRVREEAAVERMDRLRLAGAATPLDVNRALNNLRQDLVKRQESGGEFGLVRDGQAELAERIGQLALKMERIEVALRAKGAAGKAH